MVTKSGFHKGQNVRIVKNWRTNQPDGRCGVVNSIRRAYHGAGADVSTAIEIEVLTDNGKYHATFSQYLEGITLDPVCRECGGELTDRELLIGTTTCRYCGYENEVTSEEYRGTVFLPDSRMCDLS